MITFSKLGEYGRFGNQMFQYAFLRTQAKRLGVFFYCPEWIGDTIFNLDDKNERSKFFSKPKFFYFEGDKKHGFNVDATKIRDGTEIVGYFQTDRFFSKEDVLEWFVFKEELFKDVREKYKNIDFSNTTSIHLRLGDYLGSPLLFYVSKISYFKKALSLVEHKKHILVFSDNPNLAKKHLSFIGDRGVFVEGNKDYEDFYLMSRCRDMICSTSTFCWWSAYLNPSQKNKIISPQRLFLPGAPTKNNDLFNVKGWINLPAHHFFDNYYVRVIPVKIKKCILSSFVRLKKIF